jgi:hypothetical protein
MMKIIKSIIQFFKNLFSSKENNTIAKIETRRFPRNPRHYLNGLVLKNSLKLK